MADPGEGSTAHQAAKAPWAPHRRRIQAPVWDAELEARARREAAVREGRAIVEAAEARAEELRAAARAAGLEEGLARAVETLARAAAERDRILTGAEPALIDLAFGIAGRVVATLGVTDRRIVVHVAARALAELRGRGDVTVRVHGDDLAALREAEPALLSRLAGVRTLRVVADGAVPPGGAVAEAGSCRIDARLATQVAALRRALAEAAGA